MLNNNIESSMELFRNACQEHGMKITPQRTVVYIEFARSKDHPSADILYKRVKKSLPNISFDTVYRTLLSFSEMGIADVVEGYGEPKRFDPDTGKHHHFRCMKCGKIIDFRSELYDSIKIPKKIEEDFTVINRKVILEGFCEYCGNK